MSVYAVLAPEQVRKLEELVAVDGRTIFSLMEAAGTAVAEQISQRWAKQPVVVLCGTGNNGGDGIIAACQLREAGWPVEIWLLGRYDRLTKESTQAAQRWGQPLEALTSENLKTALSQQAIVVDGLFGLGLSRHLEGLAVEIAKLLAGYPGPVVAIDIPSGVHAGSGRILGHAVRADLTVTFFRKKIGQLLMPGRLLCGQVVVADLGLSAQTLAQVQPSCFENQPRWWLNRFPLPHPLGHKYNRGQAVIFGGRNQPGACLLAARAAQRIGAGLATIICDTDMFSLFALANKTATVETLGILDDPARVLKDPRRNAVLLGPGLGISERSRGLLAAAMASGRPCVFDADALSLMAHDKMNLSEQQLSATHLLTPHQGEYERIFSSRADQLTNAKAAAVESRAIVLLKGASSVVAHPDGNAVINTNAPANLATAGSGDVLAGIALGLIAQGVETFHAACMAAWFHGQVAEMFGHGLVADDLPEMLPQVLNRLLKPSMVKAQG